MSFDQQRIDRAFDDEDCRIRQLEREFSNDPDFLLTAIVQGWDLDRARQAIERSIKPNGRPLNTEARHAV